MSGRQRAVLLAVAAVIAVVAVVLLQADDTEDEKSDEPAQTETQADDNADSGDRTEPEQTPEAEPRAPEPVRIRVADGEPVGGVEEIEVDKGDEVVLVVTSSDTSDHVHVHGVDVMRDLAPGKPARLRFEAEEDGVFEVELEDTSTQIAELRVGP